MKVLNISMMQTAEKWSPDVQYLPKYLCAMFWDLPILFFSIGTNRIWSEQCNWLTIQFILRNR